MSASFGNEGKKGGGGSQDVELNLASIIDCFTVLITFLLASTAYMSIGIFDAGIAAAGTEAKDNAEAPSASITVELKSTREFVVKVDGKNGNTLQNTKLDAPKDATWDLVSLQGVLSELKQKYTDVNMVTLQADNEVEYRQVIATMEQIRKTQPVVILGGF